MKKVAVVNLDVGSAIEYAGEIIEDWTRELGYNVKRYKLQTEGGDTMRWMKEFAPDLIVLNEDYNRPHVVAYLYRQMQEEWLPLIYINHCWDRIVDWAWQPGVGRHEEIVRMWYEHTLDSADYIFCLNQKPDYAEWPDRVASKISNRYYPTDSDVFKVTRPWTDRTMQFCYIGNILPHKLSQEFLEKIVHTGIPVDCFGRDVSEGEYKKAFDNAVANHSVRYKGLIPQELIPEIMNRYQYLVLPHNGYEPFNWVLKQCMHCGTIPLIVNDRDSKRYEGRWLDWASGLYMGCPTVDDFLHNLDKIRHEVPDHSNLSEKISKEVRRRFPYHEFKEEYQNKVEVLLNG
jgi:glycosyltransferase involved in cell wall biosynthesis